MSRENLREAIDAISHVIDRHQGRLTRVLAAARAYACEHCNGSRKVFAGRLVTYPPDSSDASPGHPIYTECPDCIEWRRIADGGIDDSSVGKIMLFVIDGQLVSKNQPRESQTCKHRIGNRAKFNDTVYRYCTSCGMVAHEDGSFAYCCGSEYCRCMS